MHDFQLQRKVCSVRSSVTDEYGYEGLLDFCKEKFSRMKRPLKNELICEKACCLGLAWELVFPVYRYR